MIVAAVDYQSSSFGSTDKVPFCAVCSTVNVTATVGCGSGETSCVVQYRPNCDLPISAALADLAMCAIFVATVFLSKYAEKKIEDDLDESIQTATDYSVVVMDPDPDADDPDEWYRYFSEYGTVRYITIFRRNSPLTNLILQKHKISRKLVESGQHSSKLFGKRKEIERRYNEISRRLEEATGADKDYPVCRVYVTFESEEDQAHCLSALKMPDLYSRFDIGHGVIDPQHFFRGQNVLSVTEPPEPDNILWYNVELTDGEKLRSRVLSNLLAGAVMVACWYIVQYTKQVSPLLLAVVIGIIDSSLPTIFLYLTNMGVPQSEGSRQYSIQMRLFLARFLISVIIPYFQTDWDQFLTKTELQQIISVQFFACFTAPLLALTDYYGLFQRHVLSFFFADTQDELNLQWQGSDWSLAEKYTGIAKVLSVSLFYAIFSPLSILLATVAFAVIFLIDNFLLLRRWKSTAMLDAKIATRLRQQAMLVIFAHMYATLRFIYAWPMDGSHVDQDGAVHRVDKQPPYAFWALTAQSWHSSSQTAVFYKYKVAVFVVGCITFYMFAIEPATRWFCRCFCFRLKSTELSANLGFSELENVEIYYPLVYSGDDLTFLCAYTKNLLSQHRPVTVTALQQGNNQSANLQDLLKEELRKTQQARDAKAAKEAKQLQRPSSATQPSTPVHRQPAQQQRYQVVPVDDDRHGLIDEAADGGSADDFDLALMEGEGGEGGQEFSRFGLMNSFAEKDDLSFYVPVEKQARLLSVVKYYPPTANIVRQVERRKNEEAERRGPERNVFLSASAQRLLPQRLLHSVEAKAQQRQQSTRVLNTLRNRHGLSMLYLNFQLLCKDLRDFLGSLDDHLWDAADSLIATQQQQADQLRPDPAPAQARDPEAGHGVGEGAESPLDRILSHRPPDGQPASTQEIEMAPLPQPTQVQAPAQAQAQAPANPSQPADRVPSRPSPRQPPTSAPASPEKRPVPLEQQPSAIDLSLDGPADPLNEPLEDRVRIKSDGQ